MISAAQLRAARALVGIDQRELADLSGLSVPTIQRMEASEGVIRGNVDSLMKLVAALDASARVVQLKGRNPFSVMQSGTDLWLAEPGNFDAGSEDAAGVEVFDVSAQAQDAWVAEIVGTYTDISRVMSACTPSRINNEGHPEDRSPLVGAYRGGLGDWFGYRERLENWLDDGRFDVAHRDDYLGLRRGLCGGRTGHARVAPVPRLRRPDFPCRSRNARGSRAR